MSSGRVAIFGDPTLTVIKIYMSGLVKMSGHPDGRVGSQFCDPTTSLLSKKPSWNHGESNLIPTVSKIPRVSCKMYTNGAHARRVRALCGFHEEIKDLPKLYFTILNLSRSVTSLKPCWKKKRRLVIRIKNPTRSDIKKNFYSFQIARNF